MTKRWESSFKSTPDVIFAKKLLVLLIFQNSRFEGIRKTANELKSGSVTTNQRVQVSNLKKVFSFSNFSSICKQVDMLYKA